MRTTVNLDDNLLKEARATALATGRTLSALIEDALRQNLAGRPAARRRKRIILPVDKDSRLLPGISLDDSADLLDIMEGRRAVT